MKLYIKPIDETIFRLISKYVDSAAQSLRMASGNIASAVLDATGTWSAQPLGANGLAAPGEAALRPRIAFGMPVVLGAERQRYAGRRVLVVGTGHSAAGTLLALALADERAKASSATGWGCPAPAATRDAASRCS